MKKVLLALVALTSLFVTCAAQGQSADGQAADSTPRAQEMNERTERAAPELANVKGADSDKDAKIVLANETAGTISLKDRSLIIRGRVKGDVNMENGDVVIEPGGRVEGKIVIKRGAVRNLTSFYAAVAAPAEVIAPAEAPAGTIQAMSVAKPAKATAQKAAKKDAKKDDWFGAQVALLLCGLVGSAILSLVAPRAAAQASHAVGLEKGRSLAVGILASIGLGIVSLINAGLTQTPFSLLWAPFGFVVATATLLLFGYGWLCGMRFVGDGVARRLGQQPTGGSFGRMALGLFAFFLLNVVLGALHLHTVGLLMQGVLTAMGLGAAFITGFGTQTNWLGARMRGNGFPRRP